MKALTIGIIVEEDGTAKLIDSNSESMIYQSYTNAFEMGKIRAEKFIAECKMEKSITAKKELDDAQGDSELAGGDKEETPEPV